VGDDPAFSSGCNLRCVFCRNFDISWQVHGEPVTAGRLAAMMLALQDRGCRNINLVTPVELSQDRQQDINAVLEPARRRLLDVSQSSTQMRSGCCSITSPGPPPALMAALDELQARATSPRSADASRPPGTSQ
jgi:pyruvate-formate lyase-activating enzyme